MAEVLQWNGSMRQNKREWSWGAEKPWVLCLHSSAVAEISAWSALVWSPTQTQHDPSWEELTPSQPAMLQVIEHSSVWSSGNLLVVFLCLSTSWFQWWQGSTLGAGVNHSFQGFGLRSEQKDKLGLAVVWVLWASLLPPSALTAFYSNSRGCPKYGNLGKQEEAFGYLGALTYSSAAPHLLQHRNESGWKHLADGIWPRACSAFSIFLCIMCISFMWTFGRPVCNYSILLAVLLNNTNGIHTGNTTWAWHKKYHSRHMVWSCAGPGAGIQWSLWILSSSVILWFY